MSSFLKSAVSFLANLGGLYCFSICIFFFLLVQCEYRIKKLRHEDIVIRRLRSQRKAQQRWDKLRTYVGYTWGRSSLPVEQNNLEKGDAYCCRAISFRKSRSSVKNKKQTELATINFSKKERLSSKQNYIPKSSHAQVSSMQSSFPPVSGREERPSHSRNDSVDVNEPTPGSSLGIYRKRKASPSTTDDLTIPPPPSLGSKAFVDMNLTDLKQGFQNLYDYNAILNEKLVAAQSAIHDLSKNLPSSSSIQPGDSSQK